MTRLTICVPTYGRAALLQQLLESIAREVVDRHSDVDVVVSDDASPDNTAAAARSKAIELGLPVTVLEQPTNIGFERNFLAVVDAAPGQYVWLMGDDDALEIGAVSAVLSALDRFPTVAGLTLGAGDYDSNLGVKTAQGILPPDGLLSGSNEVFVALGDFVGFMSTLVMRRDLWQEAVQRIGEHALIPAYPQVQIMAYVLRNLNREWAGVGVSCVRYRADNDHLLALYGWDRRLKIDVEGYRSIRSLAFTDRRLARRFESRVVQTHIRARVVNAKADGLSVRAGIAAAASLTRWYAGYPAFWLQVVALLVIPSPLVRLLRAAYQRVPGTSTAALARAEGER